MKFLFGKFVRSTSFFPQLIMREQFTFDEFDINKLQRSILDARQIVRIIWALSGSVLRFL